MENSVRQRPIRPASAIRRVPAFVVDLLAASLLGLIPVILVETGIPNLSDTTYGLIAQVTGLVIFLAYSLLVTLTRGQSAGKSLLGVVIVSADGSAATDRQIVVRFIALGVSLAMCSIVLPLTPLPRLIVYATLGLLAAPIVFRSDRRAFHDLIAGTTVIVVPGPDSGETSLRTED